jgi:hypothetical protein
MIWSLSTSSTRTLLLKKREKSMRKRGKTRDEPDIKNVLGKFLMG